MITVMTVSLEVVLLPITEVDGAYSGLSGSNFPLLI